MQDGNIVSILQSMHTRISKLETNQLSTNGKGYDFETASPNEKKLKTFFDTYKRRLTQNKKSFTYSTGWRLDNYNGGPLVTGYGFYKNKVYNIEVSILSNEKFNVICKHTDEDFNLKSMNYQSNDVKDIGDFLDKTFDYEQEKSRYHNDFFLDEPTQ